MISDRNDTRGVHPGATEGATPGLVSRRDVLLTSLAATLLPATARAAEPGAQRLVAGTRMLEVNGRAARVFGLVGPNGRPGIYLDPGDRFHVALLNETGTQTLVHWHGQLPPWKLDGFPWPQTPPFPNGTVQTYDYAPIAGTYWMHSHHEMQEQSLLAAPLIVRDTAARREDRQEVVVLLHDFTFRTPDEVLAGLTGTRAAASPGGMSGHAMPGMPMPGTPMQSTPMQGMSMPGMSMPGMSMPGMAMESTSKPKTGMSGMDLNDVQYDAFLANDRTLLDPEVVRVEHGGRVRLRIINGASASQFWIDLGALSGRVVATDGHDVRPVAGNRFPLAMAQRLDILVDLPAGGVFPILARLEGSTQRTGIVLATADAHIPRLGDTGDAAPPIDNSLELRLAAATPLAARPADLVHTVTLGGSMAPYAWSMNGEYWPRITPLMLRQGQRVEIELVNPTMMAHPIHLHGHAFQVIAIDGKPIQGAIRDTVLVSPMGGRVRFAFNADNPGRWAFHCHNLYHMMTGMMTEVRYEGIAV